MAPDTDVLDRRTVLRSAAGVLAAGTLAGCSSGGSGDGGSNDSGGSGTETEAATDGDAATEATATDGGATSASTDNGSAGNASTANGTAEANGTAGTNATTTNGTTGTNNTSATNGTAGTTVGTGAVDEYLAEAKGYDGSIVDETGSDAIEIAVGAGESGFAFDPAAVRVSPGTTITWQWTGKGGRHNVVSMDDGPLDSGSPRASESVTYEETLDSPGVYRYYCNPHRSLGMKGAVVVTNG